MLMADEMGLANVSMEPASSDTFSCLIGDPYSRDFAQQLNKPDLGDEDSFLVRYKMSRVKNLLPQYFVQNPIINTAQASASASTISREQIHCAMKRIPFIPQRKKICQTSNESGRFQNNTPCVTRQLVDYIHWGLNETLKCYGNLLDEVEKRMIFKKINHESAFGFFFQYKGGTGIAQLVSASKKDLFFEGGQAHSFVTQHISNNSRQCQSFSKLMERATAATSLKSCEFISVGDGIGRSLLGGIGLYLHYRSDPKNRYSAERLLAYWGVQKTNSKEYRKLRSYITLGMYNKGPGAVISTIRNKIAKGSLTGLSDKEAYAAVTNQIKKSNFAGYLTAIERSSKQILNEDGSCKI